MNEFQHHLRLSACISRIRFSVLMVRFISLPLRRWEKAHFTDALNLKHKRIIQQLKQLKKEKISVLPLELGAVFQA